MLMCDSVLSTGSAQAAASDIHQQMPMHMADIRRDWLTDQNRLMLCCDWFSRKTIPQSFAAAKKSIQFGKWVRHIGWHLADAREYLLISVASTVSRRIFIYIRGAVFTNVM